jgi:DNA-binding NtrC family response regulator
MKKSIKILSIDGEEIILKSIGKALKSDSDIEYILTTCKTAVDGLKLIRNNPFDLVLIDLVLPGMDGFEVLRRIKNIDASIPVIIMTGFSPVNIHSESTQANETRDEAIKSAAGFLLKPFTTREIISLIHRIVK